MDEKGINQENSSSAIDPAKEERKRIEASLKRQQLLEDQSLREGFRFLFKSVLQFILFVSVGAFLIIKSQDFSRNGNALGVLFLAGGTILILRGMISLGGFRSK